MSDTYEGLLKKIAQLKEEAEIVKEKEKGDAIAEIKKKIEIYQLTTEDLGLALHGGKKTPRAESSRVVVAKYRDPDTQEEWSGRGRLPRWLQSKVDAGQDKEAFLIKEDNP